MNRDNERNTAIGHIISAFVIIMIGVLMVLLFASCKTTEQANSQRIELVRGVELKQDSTHHRYEVHRVTLYDAGQVARVEEVESHDLREVVRYERDTLYINEVDTLYITKRYPQTPTAKNAGRWLGITLAITILGGGLVVYWWCKKRLPF